MTRALIVVLVLAGALTLLGVAPSAGETAAVPDSVDIIPGQAYGATWITRPLRGAGHRQLWSTRIRVALADLGRLGGGLTPLYSTPLEITHALYLRGNDSKLYAFRSVSKDFARMVPPDLRGTRVERTFNDIAGTLHPTGSVVVSELAGAVGLQSPAVELRVVPDDPRLGGFRKMFAGELVTFSEVPEGRVDGGFAGATEIIPTSELLGRWHRGDVRPGVETFLAARLFDLVIGDRYRGPVSWLWAYGTDGSQLWRPIPQRRAQAFMDVGGIWRPVLGFYTPGFASFKAATPPVKQLATISYDLDRTLLPAIGKTRWNEITREVQDALSDDVIERAVRRLPRQHYETSGADLAHKLRVRRDRLPEATADFYRRVARYADLDFTDGDDRVFVERRENGDVFVQSVDDGGEGTHLARLFERDDTKEIRLYLRDGNDRVDIRGRGRDGIRVRIATGAGTDTVAVAPGASAKGTTLYGVANIVVIPDGDEIDHKAVDAPRRILWGDGLQPIAKPDWGTTLHWKFSFSINGDFGFRPKIELYRDGLGFLQPDYKKRSKVALRYSTQRKTGSIELVHIHRDIRKGLHFIGRVFGSRIERIRYFGIGNETTRDLDKAFYNLDYAEVEFQAGVAWGSEDDLLLSVAAVASAANTDTTAALGTLMSIDRPYGSGEFNLVGFQGRLLVDRRDDFERPSAGYALEAGAGVYPETADLTEGTFGEVWGHGRGYLPLWGSNPILAGKAYAATTFGTPPFSRQPWIGGQDLLRAFEENRFLGDAAVSASLELRWALFSSSLLFVPVDLGLVGFTDVGRVFVSDESSRDVHVSGGFGVYAAPGHLGIPAFEDLLMRLLFAWSEEDFSLYFGWGLSF